MEVRWKAGTEIIEAPKGKSETTTYAVTNTIEYAPTQLDRSVINRNKENDFDWLY